MPTQVYPTCTASQTTVNSIFKGIGVGIGTATMLATMALCVNSNNYTYSRPDCCTSNYIVTSDCSGINSSNINYNGIIFSFPGDAVIETKRMKNIEKLNNLRSFGENWNGYGASAISYTLIDTVIDLLSVLPIQPEVFPLSSGKIQIEFDDVDGKYLEFELSEHYRASVYQVDADNNESEYETDFNLREICRIVNDFYG